MERAEVYSLRSHERRAPSLRVFRLPVLYVASGRHAPLARRGARASADFEPLLTGRRGFLFMNRIDAEAELMRLRDAIDRVDEVIVKLLNQRAKYAIEIGELKGVLELPIYVPEREKAVLNHVEEVNAGPLDP